MVPNVELHLAMTRTQRAEIQQEIAGIRRARLVRSARSTAQGPRGLWLSGLRLWAACTRALAPGAVLPPVA